MKKTSFWLALLLLTYGLVEVASLASLWVLDRFYHTEYQPVDVLSQKHRNIIEKFIQKEPNYYTLHPALGWTIKKNGRFKQYEANSSGFRASREYQAFPDQGVLRLAAFGDSFTHSDDVTNAETWEVVMESLDPGLEVLNFGVGGYGLDQAYLRYLTNGKEFNPHIVVIGIMSENIFRNVSRFRPFYSPGTTLPLSKPRYIIDDRTPALLPNPLSSLADYETLLLDPSRVLTEIGTHDFFFSSRYKANAFDWSPAVRLAAMALHGTTADLSAEPVVVDGSYNEKSEAYIVTRAIFDEFHSTVVENGSVPIIVIFPNRNDFLSYSSEGVVRYAPLLSYFESRGYQYVNLMDAFAGVKLERPITGHYPAFGNEIVAKHMVRVLRDEGHRPAGDDQ